MQDACLKRVLEHFQMEIAVPAFSDALILTRGRLMSQL